VEVEIRGGIREESKMAMEGLIWGVKSWSDGGEGRGRWEHGRGRGGRGGVEGWGASRGGTVGCEGG